MVKSCDKMLLLVKRKSCFGEKSFSPVKKNVAKKRGKKLLCSKTVVFIVKKWLCIKKVVLIVEKRDSYG